MWGEGERRRLGVATHPLWQLLLTGGPVTPSRDSAASAAPSRAVILDAIHRCAGLCRTGLPARLRLPTTKGIRPTRGK